MARLSKLDRMAAIESLMEELDVESLQERLAEAAEAAEKAHDAVTQVTEAIAEAQSYHEDRDWDSRNDALDTANDGIEELETALDTLADIVTPELVNEMSGTVEQAREKYAEAKGHIDNLVEV